MSLQKRLRIIAENFVSRRSALRLGRVREHPNLQLGYVPDRFCWQYEKYRTLNRAYSPASEASFLKNNSVNNAGDLVRFYFLTLACDTIEEEGLQGDLAELGVYKGNTAFLLAELARRTKRTAYLFDTFESFAEQDLVGIDQNMKSSQREFSDTSLEDARQLVGESNVKFIKGYFPGTADSVPASATFSLVHLDCDLYAPIRAGLEFFYPRLVPGGFLIVHDYSSYYWEGVKMAVDEFLANRPERIVPIPDKSGTVVIRKL
jgi:O-methyltransferase